MNWQDEMEAGGWNPISLYHWQHRDGRALTRHDNGYWYLSVPMREGVKDGTAKISKLGRSMGDAFASVLSMRVKA